MAASQSLSAFVFWLCLTAATSAAAEEVDYLRDIKPVLRERCYACHGALKQQADLRLDTGSAIRQGGASGAAAVASDPDSSPLIERISADDLSIRMPPEGQPLTAEQIALFRRWISQGAGSPVDEQPEKDPRQHWSFQAPVRPALPETNAGESPANAIDALLAARHAQQGVAARPRAEKHILLRRVYLDLIGLPPTRQELQAFLADESLDAYQRVVDRLLADPRYGERWARHWMDIWRYSDWYGRRHVPDVWNSAPQIWRWRDWIVQSLNHDKGYDRMVAEMLAADEICPEDDNAAVATGYLIRNWYALNPNDWMRNTVEHTGKAFLGLTFNCAHCHDHKYDPISHDDYFRLRAFFEPMHLRQDRVPGEADPGPFQEYDYSKVRKVQRLGAVRVFDKNPDAPTWFYTGGDERNRVKDRPSIAPGVPEVIAAGMPEIKPVELPPRFRYPGLRPAIQETVLADCRAAIAAAEKALAEARQSLDTPSTETEDKLAKARAAFDAALREAEQAGRPGALAGRQSLLLDATHGRRTVHNSLSNVTTWAEELTFDFQLLLLADAHVNFQFAKDVLKGLTAGYVGFDKGRIVSYQPGTFNEFEAGKYDFAAGQNRLQVSLLLQTAEDRALLTVRSLTDDKLLVDRVPVAINGWNPVGDPTKAILFDARTGSRAVIDDIALTTLAAAATAGGSTPTPLARFDFEPPTYSDERDVVGQDGWVVSSLSAAPAKSIVSQSAANAALQQAREQFRLAQRAAAAPQLQLQAAESRLSAARAALASAEARIVADKAKYSETPNADAAALAKVAWQREREAAVSESAAQLAASDHQLAVAEAKPESDANRAKEIDAAAKQLAAARTSLEKAQAALSEGPSADAMSTTYTPFSPVYPQTSTGRRRALAEWITSRQNPLAARVAVNHIWGRHFHRPLVATVTDFGRNGATPEHPDILDWLAVELMESGWSMKHLHRLIVTSEAFMRVSSVGAATQELAADPENKLLWRMNSGRMEAEVVRDSLLYASGRLDLTMGGQELENTAAPTTFRRSLYYSVYPEAGGNSAMSQLFDPPDALECYRRTRSIVPQQALALTNSDLVHTSSVKIVADWDRDAAQNAAEKEPADDAFVTAMFEQILSRAPSARERQVTLEALQTQRRQLLEANPQDANAAAKARQGIVRALINHNDFITIR